MLALAALLLASPTVPALARGHGPVPLAPEASTPGTAAVPSRQLYGRRVPLDFLAAGFELDDAAVELVPARLVEGEIALTGYVTGADGRAYQPVLRRVRQDGGWCWRVRFRADGEGERGQRP